MLPCWIELSIDSRIQVIWKFVSVRKTTYQVERLGIKEKSSSWIWEMYVEIANLEYLQAGYITAHQSQLRCSLQFLPSRRSMVCSLYLFPTIPYLPLMQANSESKGE